jgi:hypothetical protein
LAFLSLAESVGFYTNKGIAIFVENHDNAAVGKLILFTPSKSIDWNKIHPTEPILRSRVVEVKPQCQKLRGFFIDHSFLY